MQVSCTISVMTDVSALTDFNEQQKNGNECQQAVCEAIFRNIYDEPLRSNSCASKFFVRSIMPTSSQYPLATVFGRPHHGRQNHPPIAWEPTGPPDTFDWRGASMFPSPTDFRGHRESDPFTSRDWQNLKYGFHPWGEDSIDRSGNDEQSEKANDKMPLAVTSDKLAAVLRLNSAMIYLNETIETCKAFEKTGRGSKCSLRITPIQAPAQY